MPNSDNLKDLDSSHTAYLSTLDLQDVYIQLNLDPDTASHCNFIIISGYSTGTYKNEKSFYGLTDMPLEFQIAMYFTLVGLKNTHCFLDDILIVSRSFFYTIVCKNYTSITLDST